MNQKERKIIQKAYESFKSTFIDYYSYSNTKTRFNFESLGKALIIHRMLVEFLQLDINQALLPGEFTFKKEEDDDIEDWIHFSSGASDSDLTTVEKDFLITILEISNSLSGLNDSDEACLRCFRRMIAEVIHYQPLSHYRLLMEKEVKNLYLI
jgi:hypothetical protein